MYNCARWRNYRLVYLRQHPLCADPFSRHEGTIAAASVVDHITPHRGDYALFWDTKNHRALCAGCNSYKAAKFEGAFGNAPSNQETKGKTENERTLNGC
jgi:5-methylcytosine-specific restriction protein A